MLDCLAQKTGWLRPYGDVAISSVGAESCKSQCLAGGYAYFGMECPMSNGYVHCQCANEISGTSKHDSYCAGTGSLLVHAHDHCVGPYVKDGYFFGDYAVDSVYSTARPMLDYLAQKSGWVRPYGNVAISRVGGESCRLQCTAGDYAYFGMECPMSNGEVHCQCANEISGTSKHDLYCAGEGRPLVHSHDHCVGPYAKGGYFFGDYGVGSVYSTQG